MALSIKHDEADRLARELSALTGETLTEAVLLALRERLSRQRAHRDVDHRLERALEIARQCSSLPLVDPRAPDEILGYDTDGIPG